MIKLTIKDLPAELGVALENESKRIGKSINDTAIILLRESLGITDRPGKWTNGLEKFAGRWTEEEVLGFERNTAATREIDEELWR